MLNRDDRAAVIEDRNGRVRGFVPFFVSLVSLVV